MTAESGGISPFRICSGLGFGPVELWHVDDLARRRALQTVGAAESDVQAATEGEATARNGYTAARQEAQVVRRVQERRRTEMQVELQKRERRDVDELATLRFNTAAR